MYVVNHDKQVGYISELLLGDGIYLGNDVVTNDTYKSYLQISDTMAEPIEIIFFTETLEDFYELTDSDA